MVERVSGRDFAAFCRAEIFMRLGMEHTTFEYMHDVAYVAKPYLPDGRETLEPYINLYPEGSVVSTAADMAAYMRWMTDLQDARVLAASSKAALMERQYAMSDGLPGMGYTWNRKAQNGTIYNDKKGETLHFYSRNALFPGKKAGVFFSVNPYLAEERLEDVVQIAADTLCGCAKNGEGGTRIDIAGVYKNNCSSDSTMEKVLRYIVPGKMMRIHGAIGSGYSINGQMLKPVGQDEYTSPMGVVKFLERGGRTLIVSQSATTYTKVSRWEDRNVQASVPVIVLILLMMILVFELAAPLRGWAKKDAVTIASISLEIILLGALAATIVYRIMTYKLLEYQALVRSIGWGIAVLSAIGVWRARNKQGALRAVSVLGAILRLALIAQMCWFHILI